MAHEWQDVRPKHPLGEPERRCVKCGAHQAWTKDHLWGRVVSARWVPTAGRCPADKKSSRDVTFPLASSDVTEYGASHRQEAPMLTSKFTAHIGNDPIDSRVFLGCATAEAAAKAARNYAEFGETITVVGPKGGRTEWQAVGTGPLATVWRKGRK